MIKACVCSVAVIVGAMIGANAPAEWRTSPRLSDTSMSAAELKPFDIAMVYRPYQR